MLPFVGRRWAVMSRLACIAHAWAIHEQDTGKGDISGSSSLDDF